MLSSPLAAATRARIHRQNIPPPARERGLRIVAMAGALLVHLVFLFAFVLGPAYQAPSPGPPPDFLQVRLVEPPAPPPPPPVRGTPPKERGPQQQGRRRAPAAVTERSANVVSVVEPSPPRPAPRVPVAEIARPRAPVAEPAATPPAPVSLPRPAPAPELQPVPLAVEPPRVTVDAPALRPPVPPKFQPEQLRAPQPEGNRPMPPAPSLALPELPPQAAPTIVVTSMALTTEIPRSSAPVRVTPARAELAAAPASPELQPVPVPAHDAPRVNLQTSLSVSAPTMAIERPQVQVPALEVAAPELDAVPLAPSAAPEAPPLPTPAINVADVAPRTAVQPSVDRPELSAAAAPAASAPSAPVASEIVPAPSASTAVAAAPSHPAPAEADRGDQVSRAPDATPQGSDVGTPGAVERVPEPDQGVGVSTAVAPPTTRSGADAGSRATQPGGNQPGAQQGEQRGALGSYVQLRPRGDTEIMRHRTPNIDYRATRFEQDWTPEGESSVDTALRRAVEKTAVSHTFHLPRGVRVECTVMPLLPIALLGCANPDPPAKPVDEKVYDRLHLAPANPVAAPASATTTPAPGPAPMIKFDSSAECAAARVAGGPPPPGCAGIVLPVKPAGPASSSSSWVPASDQFR